MKYVRSKGGGAYMVSWIEFDTPWTLFHEFWHRLCFFFFIKLFSPKEDHIKIFEGWTKHPLKPTYDKFTVLIHWIDHPKWEIRRGGKQ